MKTLLMLLLLLPWRIMAQTDSIQPIKKANKIIVSNGKSAIESFALLQELLLRKNYALIINRPLGAISTKDSLIEAGTASYVIRATIRGEQINLTGSYKTMVVTTVFTPEEKVYNYDIANSGSKGTLAQKTFTLLNQIAIELGGSRTYVREKRKKKGAIF
jgi:hypothetical protein